jgi:hypothetical protein
VECSREREREREREALGHLHVHVLTAIVTLPWKKASGIEGFCWSHASLLNDSLKMGTLHRKDTNLVDIVDSFATLHKFAYAVSRWLSPSPSLLCSEHVFSLGEAHACMVSWRC